LLLFLHLKIMQSVRIRARSWTGEHASGSIPIASIPARPALNICYALSGADTGIYSACYAKSLGSRTGAIGYSC